MYWINGIASELSLSTAINSSSKKVIQHDNASTPTFSISTNIVSIKPSYLASLFITCTLDSIYLWSTKPTVILSFVQRSQNHIEEFGKNKSIIWKPDNTAFVILVSNTI